MSSELSQLRIRRTAADVLGAELKSVDDVIEAVMNATSDHGDPERDDADRDDQEALIEHTLLQSGEFVEIGDRVGHLPSLLDGTRWVCAVSEHAAETGALPSSALAFISFLVLDRPLTLKDAAGDTPLGEVTLEEVESDDEIDHLVGPAGWLRDAGGRHVEFAFGPDATACVTVVDEVPPVDPRLAESFAAAYDAAAHDPEYEAVTVGTEDGTRESEFAVIRDVAIRMIAGSRDVLCDTTVPPIDALAVGCGFETERALVAQRGFDWDALHAWQARTQLAWRWHLDPEDAEFLQIMLGASLIATDGHGDGDELFVDDEERCAVSSMFGIALERPGVAEGFWGERIGSDPSQVLAFVTNIVDGDGGLFGGARWVAARCLDHLGRPLEAEAILQESVGGEVPDHPAAMEMLADFRADRGDAPGAISMLQRADLFDVDDPDDLVDVPLLHELAPFASGRAKATVGRNEPCPCGSGKKYKRCHLGHERHPLHDRVNWLFTKMARYVRDNRFAPKAVELADVMVEASGPGFLSRTDILDAPWLTDLVLTSCGADVAFANERDALLPDDEAMLAVHWSVIEPSVFEVRSVTEDAITLIDLRNGDTLTVVNVTPDDNTRPGTVLYGRPLPVGDTWRALSGFVGVPTHLVEAMIAAIDEAMAGDAVELAARLGATFATPTLTNTAGESTRFHTQTWSVAGVEDVEGELREAGLVDDGDGRFSLVRDTDANPNTVIATMRLDDETLTVECNSDERAHEVVRLLVYELPDARLVDHDYFETDEMMRRAANGEGKADGVASLKSAQLADPEIRELLVAEVARSESEWLDAPIPALDGRSPRECALDPVGREQLLRLLASFPETDEPTEMSPGRLRAALGL